MRTGTAIVALLMLMSTTTSAQARRWHVDVGLTALAEAWDYNESRERLGGVVVGVDRRVWRAMAVRAEATVLHVSQVGADAWLTGATLGTRARWVFRFGRPFLDLAAGLSHATRDIPVRGTASNYVLVAGGGLEVPVGPASLEFGARWLHISNNGRAGRARNPDIQTLGGVVTVGWTY